MTQSDCEPCRISRRAVLKGAGAVTTVAVALPSIGTSVAFASTNATRHGDVIVNVFMRGGMDGQSAVVPISDRVGFTHLMDARPTIRTEPSATIPLTADFGLHPAMAALMPMWNAGDLAIIPTAGFPLDNRSHFTSQRQIDFGSGSLVSMSRGWLARYLDRLAATDPVGIRAASMPTGEQSLFGSDVSITMGSIARFSIPGFSNAPVAIEDTLRNLHSLGDDIVTSRARQAIEALEVVRSAEVTPPANGAQYPTAGRGRGFGEQMRQIAQLIRADVGIEAATTRAGLGWDTHGNQGNHLAGANRDQNEALADVLAAFYQDLGPLKDRVTVVLMTEFGRTFAENGNGGTDHGRASNMYVIGGGIRGGVYDRDWPGLAPSDRERNAVRVTTDYRYVLADILEHRAGMTDLGYILPGLVIDESRRLNLADPVGPVPETPPAPEPEPEPPVVVPPPSTHTPEATYRWVAPGGGEIRFELPPPPDDPVLVETETVRQLLDGDPASYLVAVLDNTNGVEALHAPIVLLGDGTSSLTHREAWVLVELWATNDIDSTFTDRTLVLVESIRDSAEVAPGAVGSVLLAASGSPIDPTELRLVAPDGSEVVLEPVAIDLTAPGPVLDPAPVDDDPAGDAGVEVDDEPDSQDAGDAGPEGGTAASDPSPDLVMSES